jgi:hypothetical protein
MISRRIKRIRPRELKIGDTVTLQHWNINATITGRIERSPADDNYPFTVVDRDPNRAAREYYLNFGHKDVCMRFKDIQALEEQLV